MENVLDRDARSSYTPYTLHTCIIVCVCASEGICRDTERVLNCVEVMTTKAHDIESEWQSDTAMLWKRRSERDGENE